MLKFSGGAYISGESRAKKVQGDSELPDSVDVVVIGGGFVGCCTALNLAERGVSVAICEKGVVAGEASGRAAGLIEYEQSLNFFPADAQRNDKHRLCAEPSHRGAYVSFN